VLTDVKKAEETQLLAEAAAVTIMKKENSRGRISVSAGLFIFFISFS
jgi:hypothetical protein